MPPSVFGRCAAPRIKCSASGLGPVRHPNGNLEPNGVDRAIAQWLNDALARVEILALDRIVATDSATTSLAGRAGRRRGGVRQLSSSGTWVGKFRYVPRNFIPRVVARKCCQEGNRSRSNCWPKFASPVEAIKNTLIQHPHAYGYVGRSQSIQYRFGIP